MHYSSLALSHTVQRVLRGNVLLFLLFVLGFILWSIPIVSKLSIPGINFYLALMAVPLCLNVQVKNTYSIRYGILALLLAALYWYLQVQTLYFLCFCAILLFTVEQLWGKLGRLPFLIMLTVSPLTHYLIHISSFPIRLRISEACAQLLSLAFENTYAEGNIIYTNNEPFEVEPACLGLNTLITGAIIGYAILGFLEHQKKRSTHPKHFILWMLLLGTLLIVSNLFRIITLVLFKIPPETVLHDAVGLLSLLLYALLPLWKLSPWFIKGKVFTVNTSPKSKSSYLTSIVVLGISTGIVLGHKEYNAGIAVSPSLSQIIPSSIEGFEKSSPNIDVTRFSNNESIVFYKPCKSFYQGTHSAAGCWQGSGYQLRSEKVLTVNGTEVMTALLEKDSIKLYTAWWYESETDRSIGELNWRFKMIKTGKQYTIVNVSCISRELLHTLLSDYFLTEETLPRYATSGS